jgi:hypothetical protein
MFFSASTATTFQPSPLPRESLSYFFQIFKELLYFLSAKANI